MSIGGIQLGQFVVRTGHDQWRSFSGGDDPIAQASPAELWCLISLPFVCVLLRCCHKWYSIFGISRNSPVGMSFQGSLQRGPVAEQVQLQPMHFCGHLIRFLVAIHIWLPPMLDSDVPQEAKLGTKASCY